MSKTIEDKDYILSQLCNDFKKKLYSQMTIQSESYIVSPKSKTMYIVKRLHSKNK